MRMVTKSPRSNLVSLSVGSAPRSISSEVIAYDVVSRRPSGEVKNPSLSFCVASAAINSPPPRSGPSESSVMMPPTTTITTHPTGTER